jgi:hypothetical protein
MLEEKNIHLKKKLQGLYSGASDKWQTFKSEFDYELEDLKKVFADLNKKNNK